jgi:hypothetical protein
MVSNDAYLNGKEIVMEEITIWSVKMSEIFVMMNGKFL